MTNLTSEIDDLIAIAQSGRDTPLLSGPHLIFWGALTVVALVLSWALLAGLISRGNAQWIGGVWLACIAIGVVGSVLLGRKCQNKPGANSLGNIAAKKSFIAGGVTIYAYAAGVIVRNGVWAPIAGIDSEPILYDLIITISFLVYSVVFSTLGALIKRKWFYTLAAIAGACAFATLIVIGTPMIYLVGAFGVAAVLVLPGGLLMLRQPHPSGVDIDG